MANLETDPATQFNSSLQNLKKFGIKTSKPQPDLEITTTLESDEDLYRFQTGYTVISRAGDRLSLLKVEIPSDTPDSAVMQILLTMARWTADHV